MDGLRAPSARDHRDLEIERLKAENARLREREGAALADAERARRSFSDLTAMSRRFAASMRGGMQERQQNRRRLAAQLAVSRVLAEASDLQEVAPKVFEIVGERLGWEVGAFWTVEEGGAGEALRLAGMWRCGGVPPGALERASEGLAFRRGRGLPGRVWERGEPVWVEDVGEDAEFVRGEAADEDGMRGAMAFPVVDGGLVGVFEFFRREVLPPDEDLMRTAALTGRQIGQFVERRRAEEALGKSEENYRVMVDQAVAGILKLDLSGNVVFANERFAEMLGCSVKETLRLTIADIVHEEDAARNAELFERLRTEGRAFEIEKRLVRKDGSLVWVYNHVAPIFGEDGRPVQAAVVSVNINERRRAEALLDVQKRALEMVAGGDPLPDVLKYLAGVVEGPLVDSRSAASILLLDEGGRLYNGASPSLPQEYVEAIEGLEADENVGTCAAAAATGETVVTPDIDADPNWQDLKHLPLELGLQSAWSMPISNADGRVLGTFGTYFREKREPTEFERQTVEILAGTAALAVEHGRAEKAVRESEERFRALVGRGADMITVSNRDGRIVYASPTTERVSGYTPEEFAALDPFDNIYPEDRPRCEEAFRRLVDEPGLSLDLQHRVRHKSGGWRWVEGTFTSLFDEPAIGGLVANVRDVTLRKRAEEALLESEERYRTLFESIDEGFCVIEMIFDEDGEPADYRFLETNPSFERHTGLREAEGKRMLDLAPDHEAHWFEIYGQVATTGEPVRFERRSEALGGRWFDVYAFRLGGRESRRVALIFSDVTGRKREEGERERLRREAEEERARLEAILRQMPGGIFIAERSGRIILANEGAKRIYGKTMGSIEECGEHSLSYPEGAKIAWEDYPLVRALEGESVTDMEHYVLRDDGTRAVVRVNAAPVRDEEGNVVAAIKALDDVTAHKEAEAALGESEERLRTVVEGTPVVLFSLDREGVYKLAEGRGLEALGLEPDEVVGRSIFELFADEPEVVATALRALAGETIAENVRIRGLIFETWYSPMRDEGGATSGVIGVATDVTERKLAEEALDRSRVAELAALAEVDEAQERLAFYAGAREERKMISRELHDRVAHSMVVVRQCLELYEVFRDGDPPAAAAKLEQAKEEAKSALGATRDLSMMLRRSEVEGGLEKALSDLLETTIPADVRYKVSVEGDESLAPPHVGNQLFLILREAVRNAVTHSGCKRVTVGLVVSPEGVAGTVEDDGLGFGAGNGEVGGVGMRAMKERAALLGGALSVSSTPDAGTKVEVSVPLTGEDAR